MSTAMLHMLFTSSLGLALALLLRRPMRRLFGAGPAFVLWSLPLLLAATPWLPSFIRNSPSSPIFTVLPLEVFAVSKHTPIGTHVWLLALWGLGVACVVAQRAFRYASLLRACSAAPEAMLHHLHRNDPLLPIHRIWLHDAGPAVMWAFRTRLLLPSDFFERHDADARKMILRHECMHLRRYDAWWRLLSECVLIALWFHPLAWFALPRFQLDQELACDEAVLRDMPQHDAAYARALMRSAGVEAQLATIPWLAQPQLKERLTMISRHPRHARHRRLGYATLAALLASSVAFAQQTVSVPPANTEASQDLQRNIAIPPPYPPDAIKNHEQGLVLLKVLVEPNGSASRVDVDPKTDASPELTKAASDAAIKWHYHPKIENGKSVEGWVKVPVFFTLSPLPPRPPGPPHDMPPPPPSGGSASVLHADNSTFSNS